jgi:2,4-didehydro-3-deoxy-L-rhamnonate hydrolase
MRFANVDGRMQLVASNDRLVDVANASGTLPPDPRACLDLWDDVIEWAARTRDEGWGSLAEVAPGPPVPWPRQVFGIALNYEMHVEEWHDEQFTAPEHPAVFTKFPSCLAAATSEIPIVSGTVDWEVELVVVIGRTARLVDQTRGWDYVAGLTVGQDISEREVQMRGPAAQFCLGKSFPSFGPTGPVLVSTEGLADRDDLAIGCTVNGTQVQAARTSGLLFSVPELVARLSAIVTLFPGDLIFTGTPGGVGVNRDPQWFLAPGDVLESTIEGIGTMRNRCVAPAA